jgi:hypothetical protein
MADHLRKYGERHVLAALRLSRAALTRALAGLAVRRGTLALIEGGLQALDAESNASPPAPSPALESA